MKLEISLKDPKYCDGCPCLLTEPNYYCNLYWDKLDSLFRPQKCIEENGE